jgi:hypothetical protein
MQNKIISMVRNCTETAAKDVEISALLDAIRNGKWRKQIENIRRVYASTEGDSDAKRKAIDQFKKNLPAVTFSGRFSNRSSHALVQHSGLICADLDSLGANLLDVSLALCRSDHVFALFRSTSGDGLKAVVKVPADASRHADSFRAIAAHVETLTGKKIDESGKDVCRLCFVSDDPEIYVNDGATEIAPLPLEQKRSAQTNVADLLLRQRIATELLGSIDWQSETSGFVVCTGKHTHTTGDGKRDCQINLDGAPTVYCFHNSCRGILDGINHELRSRIGKAENAANTSAATPRDEDDETIARLAALPPLEYERIRKDEAKKLGCRETILDSLVHAKRLLMRPPSESDNVQGTAVKLADVEPWPEAVDGAHVLDAIAETFSRYVVMPDSAADASTLWCAHTHVSKAFQCSPRLNYCSPEKQCGKTTARDVVALYVPRPILTENLTTAVLFRLVDAQKPVVLADEADAWITDNEELRGLLNAGHRKGAMVYRCEGDTNEVRGFAAYAPAVLCGIGALPATLHDRSIVIRLERAKRGELQARFDSRHVEREQELCRKLARWCADNRERIEACEPKLPDSAYNRIADNWRPLFAIAEVAGGDWPQRCADAFVKLTRADADADGLRVMLLADIKQVFTGERMFSKDLIDALTALSERPWSEICRGRPISERWLARNLAAFGIHSKSMRIDEGNAKGYERTDFDDVFSRYLPETGTLSVTPSRTEVKTPNSIRHKDELVADTKNGSLLGKKGICDAVTDKKRFRGTQPLNVPQL